VGGKFFIKRENGIIKHLSQKNSISIFVGVMSISFIFFLPFGILNSLEVSQDEVPFFLLFLYYLGWIFNSIFIPFVSGFIKSISPWRWAISIWISFHIWIVIGIIVGIIQEFKTGVSHLSQIGLLPFFTIPYLGFLFCMAYLGTFIRRKIYYRSREE